MSALMRPPESSEGFVLPVPQPVPATPPTAEKAGEDSVASQVAATPPRTAEPPPPRREDVAAANSELLTRLREEAERRGHAEGLKKGEQASEARHAEAMTRLADSIDAICALRGKMESRLADELEALEPLLAGIVFEAVCKVVGEAVATPQGCADVLGALVSREKRGQVVEVRIHPADLQRLQDANESLALPQQLDGLPLVADESVTAGGCVLGLRGGEVDLRFDRQLQAFADHLKEHLLDRA